MIVVDPNDIVGGFTVMLLVLLFVIVLVFEVGTEIYVCTGVEKLVTVFVILIGVTGETLVEIIGFSFVAAFEEVGSDFERLLPNKIGVSFDFAGVTNKLLDLTSLLILVFVKENDDTLDLVETATIETEKLGF